MLEYLSNTMFVSKTRCLVCFKRHALHLCNQILNIPVMHYLTPKLHITINFQIFQCCFRLAICRVPKCGAILSLSSETVLFTGTPKVVLLVTLRDYRDANVNLPSKKQRQETYMEAKARADTEVLFQVVGASKPQHFRLYEVLSLSLSS